MHTKYTHLYNSTDLTFCVNNSVDRITFVAIPLIKVSLGGLCLNKIHYNSKFINFMCSSTSSPWVTHPGSHILNTHSHLLTVHRIIYHLAPHHHTVHHFSILLHPF